jgi:uncharacterized protein
MWFEWDPSKAEINRWKHEISFEEASTVWTDPHALIAADPLHSVGEEREWIIGVSEQARLMVVVFTQRGDGLRPTVGHRIRIISARPANKREREGYVRQF